MKKFLSIAMVAFALLSTTTSCRRSGCTNPDAVNYDSKAKKDDYSCVYDGQVAFWLDKSTCIDLQNAGIPKIKLFVNGTFQSELSSQYFQTSAPDCDANGVLKFSYIFGINETSRTFTFSVTDHNDKELVNGSFTLEPLDCLQQQL